VTTLIQRARGMFAIDPPVEAAKTPEKPVVRKASPSYHAVSIETGRNCCHEARALKGKRFLSREAPSLPLRNCSSDNCLCRYQHHEDRRAGPRRARDMGVAMDGWLEVDRRDTHTPGRGRRKSDKSG
jgi:hypothetical protein